MNFGYDLHSLMILLAFAFVVGSGITGFAVGTKDWENSLSDDFVLGLIWCGIIAAIAAGLVDWAVIYNNAGFEASALCWLGVSGGFFSLWLGVGLSLGTIKRR